MLLTLPLGYGVCFIKMEIKGQFFRRFVLQGKVVQLLDSLEIK
jgi:hypothetical protein